MSYDVRVWSVRPLDAQVLGQTGVKREQQSNLNVHVAKTWQIVVGSSDLVLEEDVPDQVSAALPGICFVTDIGLEPIGASQSAYKTLRRVLERLSKEMVCAVEDPQGDTITLPKGLKRSIPIKRAKAERFSILAMSWWFDHDGFATPNDFAQLLDFLETNLPEALPRRYGLYEPPQFQWAEQGKQHCLQFLYANRYEFTVLYPHKPVLDLHIGQSKERGFVTLGSQRRYHCNRLSLDLDAAVLSQLGWAAQLDRTWRGLSRLIKPFYGDVRIHHNLLSYPNGYSFDQLSDFHPIEAWWWNGVPQRLGQAVVIGEPYLSLWPKLSGVGAMSDGLCLVTTEEWLNEEEATSLTGPVPREIAQNKIPRWAEDPPGSWYQDCGETYPDVFPFEDS